MQTKCHLVQAMAGTAACWLIAGCELDLDEEPTEAVVEGALCAGAADGAVVHRDDGALPAAEGLYGLGDGSCEHDLCETGDPLDIECDHCATEVCHDDGYCCEDVWDYLCVEKAEKICDLDCHDGGDCEHDLCETGDPLDIECDHCATEVCHDDGYCCEDVWDYLCVEKAEKICGLDCDDSDATTGDQTPAMSGSTADRSLRLGRGRGR